jgi:hypothetical protein
MNVQTPDGVAQFPDDMSQDDISAVLRKQYGTQDAKEPPSPLSPGSPLSLSYHPEEAIWNKPADESWLHFITKRPAVSALISALNNATLGGLDILTGGAGAAAQERTAGTPFYATGAIGGAAGLGVAGEALGAGRAISSAVAPKIAPLVGEKVAPWIGNRVGGALEQGGLGLIGAGIQGQDPTQAGLISGGVGAITGPFGRLGGTAGAGPTATELTAATTKAYAPMDDLAFSKSQYKDPLDAIKANFSDAAGKPNATWKQAKSAKAAFKDLTSNDEVSASELERYRDRFWNIVKRGSVEDGLVAKPMANALDDVITKETPWNKATQSAAAPGSADVARTAGDLVHGREMDAKWLAEAQTKAGLGGPGVGPQAQSRLLTEEGQRFAPEGSPARDAMTALAKIPGSGGNLAPTTFDLHRMAHPLVGGVLGGVFGGHEDLGTIAENIAKGAAVGYAAKGAKYLNPRIWDQAATQAAARRTLTTGAPWDRFYSRPSQKLVDALRAINAAYGPRHGP